MEVRAETQVTIQPRRRELLIDIVRGFAVLGMIITHVIALTFSPNADDSTVYWFGQFGGIISFTLFLFLTGTSSYFSFLKYDENNTDILREKKASLINRIVKLLVVYYILATISLFVTTTYYSFPPNIQWGENLLRTLILTVVPPFTEYLLPIIIYWITLIPLRRLYRFLSREFLLTLTISVVFFLLGQLIFTLDLGSEELNTIKGLFGGHEDQHLFPIFQYLGIFLFGISFGRFFSSTLESFRRRRFLIIWTVLLGGLALALNLIFIQTQNPLFDISQESRFPPSVGFIIFSLFLSVTAITVIYIISKLIPAFIKALLHYFGVNALEMLFFHLIILFLLKYITTNPSNLDGVQYLYLSDILIVSTTVFLLSGLLSSVKESVKLWASNSNKDAAWWFFSEKSISSMIIIIITTFFGSVVYQEIFIAPTQANTTEFQFKKRAIQEEEWPKWWNYEYKTSRDMLITNNSPIPLFEGTWVGFNFNHRDALNRQAATRSDGLDVRVVFYDFDIAEFKELPFIFENIGSENAKIYFKTANTINTNETSDQYFMYYGNEFTTPYPKPSDKYTSTPSEQYIRLGGETSQQINANVNKRWFLKKKETAYQAASLIFETNIKDSDISENSVITYSISGTNKNGSLRKVGDDLYQSPIVVSDLEPGIYRIQANIIDSSDGIKIKRSFKIPFYVTYPLYVTWTIDWEGWSAPQHDLDAMAREADAHGMPMTHFFNPRIYVKNQYTAETITPTRAKEITDWVKERQKNKFEEIGMHIHMWNDMVAEAGVNPINTVIQGTYGYDVPTYAYSQDQIEQVFRWGRQKFAEHGLGGPISYRTGAWMSGTNVLLAAQNTGFKIDSSGRTGGPVNPTISYSTQVPWNLTETTRPYFPNIDNINTWEGGLETRMKIFEIPNNGADSYWFSGGELIRRFDLNYPTKGDILYKPQVVTYLTHPHWYLSVDSGKIRDLLNYTDQYLFRNDRGPVVYATLENIFSDWDTTKFINGD